MSQQTFSPGGTQVAEPPEPVLPDGDSSSAAGDNRRKLMMVGAAVGVLVLVIIAFFLLKGGSSSSNTSNFVVPHHPAAPVAPAAKAPVVKLPKHVTVPVGRDPFKPLYVLPVAPAAGAATGSTSTSTSSSTPTTTGGSASTTTKAPATNWAPVKIQLVSVNGTTSATFKVFYSSGSSSKTTTFFDVKAPTNSLRTAFGKVFALLSIQDGTATVQYGDGSPFDLAPGAGNAHPLG